MTVLTYCNCYIMYFQYFVLERSRDKYTVTLHRVILSVYLYERARLHSCFHYLWRNDFMIIVRSMGIDLLFMHHQLLSKIIHFFSL